jgi:hypothetical protein
MFKSVADPVTFAAAVQGGTPRAPMKHILTRLNPAGWRALKLLAVDQGRPVQTLMIEAVNDLLSKYGNGPVARSPLRERASDDA